MGMLVVARALQGFVAGPMYPVAQALMISIYPPAKRGQAIALLAMVTVVAPIAGPILGGWITENYSWEWIFFITCRSEEHTSELQSLMRISYALFCFKKKN